MAEIYLMHPKHGVKIATMEMEAQYDESHGWVRFDPTEIADEAVDAGDGPREMADRLAAGTTRLWVRLDALRSEGPAAGAHQAAAMPAPDAAAAHSGATGDLDDFDPFSPNVVVVVRKDGREAALTSLAAIERPEQLKRLAREQQLGIDPALADSADIRAAIVAAAERRIANRRAAAS